MIIENSMTAFQKKLLKPVQLPSLVKNIHVLMQALSDDTMNYNQLAEVIKQYPEITARIIFLVNSAWSAPASPISSIEQACSRLGISIIKSVSIAISIGSAFDTRKCPYFNVAQFWTSAMLVAKGASLLASRLPNKPESQEFEQMIQTAGILHNLGLLWLADNLPEETSQALQNVSEELSLSVTSALQQSTGTDYCEVGGWIGEQLKLPDELIIAMQHHLDIDYQERAWEIALIVGSAASMVSVLNNQTDEILTNDRLDTLGLDSSTQKEVFQQLSSSFEKTEALAKTLFESGG